MGYRYLFGPVPSRRLGLSLGIDLVPLKTCTLNCVYCECGETSNLTVTRREYVPTAMVTAELSSCLRENPPLDFVTFAGSGEPTLHLGIDVVIDFLKREFPHYPVCLLTNGTLFTRPDVRRQVMKADLIIPSLDAATKEGFYRLNRPHHQLNLPGIISGLASLRREYGGEICLEVFIVPGLNDSEEEVAALKEAIGRIHPDRVQVGTLDRPGTEAWVKAASRRELDRIAACLGAEVMGDYSPRIMPASPGEDYMQAILETLKRRPCTVEDLSRALNLRPAEVQKYLRQFLASGQVHLVREKRGVFLKITK